MDEIADFILLAQTALEAAGVKIVMPASDLIEFEPGEKCSGYFSDEDPDEPVFAVATGRPVSKWFPVFVHEFCHFEQWRDRRDWWNTFLMEDGNEPLDHVLEHWAGERDLSAEEVLDYCILQAEVEIDCEKRVLKKIEEHNLPIDPKHYARMANSYIAYYYAMPLLGGWCNGERPYDVEEILNAVPDHLDLQEADYFGMAEELLDVYRARCLHAKA